jgi:hypothetical protein
MARPPILETLPRGERSTSHRGSRTHVRRWRYCLTMPRNYTLSTIKTLFGEASTCAYTGVRGAVDLPGSREVYSRCGDCTYQIGIAGRSTPRPKLQ